MLYLGGRTVQYYEPWKPEVGQRVQLCPSFECEWQGMPGSDAKRSEVEHSTPLTRGMTGTVHAVRTGSPEERCGHYYLVHLDTPADRWCCFLLAAMELAPIDIPQKPEG